VTEETSPRAGDPADAQPTQPVETYPYSQDPAELGTHQHSGAHMAPAPPAAPQASAWPPPADQPAGGIAIETPVLTDPWGPEPTHYPFGFAGTDSEPVPPATKTWRVISRQALTASAQPRDRRSARVFSDH